MRRLHAQTEITRTPSCLARTRTQHLLSPHFCRHQRHYIDDLYARYEQDPAFRSTPTGRNSSKPERTRPTPEERRRGPLLWGATTGPLTPRATDFGAGWQLGHRREGRRRQSCRQGAVKGAELSAADVNQATRDSVRALMPDPRLPHARHFHAKLDRSTIEAPRDREELDPRTYGFTEADFDRKISSTTCSASNTARFREIVAICERNPTARRSASSSCISPTRRRRLDPGAHRGAGQGISFTPRGRPAILNKLIEGGSFEKFLRPSNSHRHKRFGLDGAEC